MTERHCEYCGAVFISAHGLKRFCCEDHQRKASYIRNKNNPNADGRRVTEMIRQSAPEWEYVGGYTGNDGTVQVRHKVCGVVTTKSVVTIRHRRQLICQHCRELEREAKHQAKEKKRLEAKRRAENNKLSKIKPPQLVKCRNCGQWFYRSKKRVYFCSDKCRQHSKNHYADMRKEERRRKALTEESKTITLRKLFKRDGGICWICGQPCDINADHNANNYPSVDHLLPISKGGKDEWSNIKLAHRICNTMRGNKI